MTANVPNMAGRVTAPAVQDVCARVQLKRYGGTGYSFIVEKFLPELRSRGVTEEHIQMMMVENPAAYPDVRGASGVGEVLTTD